MLLPVALRMQDLLNDVDAATLSARGITNRRLFSLIQEAIGSELEIFPDGRMLIWNIARHDGYRIPDYPMAGCGDIKEFLSDEGVKNVPAWYEAHLGMNRVDYDEMYRHELVMVCNRAYWRRVFLEPAGTMASIRSDAPVTAPALSAQSAWLAFALGKQTDRDDDRLFCR